jgi:hypothetical protein
MTFSFCTILKGSNQALREPSILCANLSSSEPRKTFPSKSDSMLCGEDPFVGSVRLSSLRLGCVRRHRKLGDVYLRRETRNYFGLPIRLKVRSSILLQSCVSHDGNLDFTESAPVVVVFTKYDQLIRSKKAELQETAKDLISEEDLDKQSKQASQEVLEVCVQSLKSAIGRMDSEMQTTTQMPPWVKISSIISHFFLDQR